MALQCLSNYTLSFSFFSLFFSLFDSWRILVEQYILMLVKNAFTLKNLSEWSLLRLALHMFERLLKLSIPNLYVWLLMFVSFFHLWMNILAELTRFGDREFYHDWWNVSNFGEYWRKWNIVREREGRERVLPMTNRGSEGGRYYY